jgi:hypothetical protein
MRCENPDCLVLTLREGKFKIFPGLLQYEGEYKLFSAVAKYGRGVPTGRTHKWNEMGKEYGRKDGTG